MNFLAVKYKNQLVLKGGMLLRLLDSPRITRDLDYSWIRTKKRNLFASELKEALKSLEGLQVVDVKTNSRGVFLEVVEEGSNLRAKVEVNVVNSFHRPPKPMSTSSLSQPYDLKPQVLASMDLAEMFSHKIAAALERDLLRDLYDIMILARLTSFDEETLRERLSKLEIRRGRPRSVTPSEAAKLLQRKIDALTPEAIATELLPVLEGQPLQGLETILKAAVTQIIAQIETLG